MLSMQQLAQRGAGQRLAEIRDEEGMILKQFPELNPHGSPRLRKMNGSGAHAAPKRKRRMSAAQRKAVSKRMKKYWRERHRAVATAAAEAATKRLAKTRRKVRPSAN